MSTISTSLTTNASRKHYLRSGIFYSVYHRTLVYDNRKVSFTFQTGLDSVSVEPSGQVWEDSGQGYWWYRLPPGTVTATGGISSSIRPESKAYAIAHYNRWYPSEGSSDTILSNFSAVVQYTNTKATPVGTCSYSGGYLDKSVDNQITFGTTKQNIDSQYVVTGGTLYYKLKDASSYSSISFTGNSCVIPAGTLQQSQYYDAYADLTCDDDMSCSITLSDLNTHDTVGTVTAISPVNTVIYGEADFTWSYSNESGASQYAYDFAVSYDNGNTWTIISNHVVSAITRAHISGINAGNILWRVRSYNQDDIASAWSNSLSIISNVAPTPPTIGNISGNGRITVSWSAADQIAYEVKIKAGTVEIYDSGVIYSAQKNHFVNQYLPNGDYEVGVRVFNGLGKYSDYAWTSFTQVTQLDGLEASASPDPGGAGVIITASMPDAVAYYLIRNGKLIARFENGIYTDNFANGFINYRVLAIDASDRFAMVDLSFEYIVESNRLILKDGRVFSVNLRWGNPFTTSQTVESRYYAAEYLGASEPEHIFSKMRTKRIQISFHDVGNAEDLLGVTVFFADTFGNGVWCVPVGLTRGDSWYGNETVLNLEMTNGHEEIEYAE